MKMAISQRLATSQQLGQEQLHQAVYLQQPLALTTIMQVSPTLARSQAQPMSQHQEQSHSQALRPTAQSTQQLVEFSHQKHSSRHLEVELVLTHQAQPMVNSSSATAQDSLLLDSLKEL